MLTRNIKVDIDPTVEELANEFCEINNNKQAEFFNYIGKDAKTWIGGFSYQMHNIIKSNHLNDDGRYILSKIAEYISE